MRVRVFQKSDLICFVVSAETGKLSLVFTHDPELPMFAERCEDIFGALEHPEFAAAKVLGEL